MYSGLSRLNLDFTLTVMESHGRVLSMRLVLCSLPFKTTMLTIVSDWISPCFYLVEEDEHGCQLLRSGRQQEE